MDTQNYSLAFSLYTFNLPVTLGHLSVKEAGQAQLAEGFGQSEKNLHQIPIERWCFCTYYSPIY